jgi:hypothetical protein
VIAPWSAFLADELASVRLTGSQQASPRGALTAALDGTRLTVRWAGSGPGLFWIGGRPVDLRAAAAAGEVLQARLRLDAPPAARLYAGLHCAAGSQAAASTCGGHANALLDITTLLSSVAPGTEVTLSLPLACFSHNAGIASVAGPLELRTAGKLALSLTDVRFLRVHRANCNATVETAK